MNEIKVLELELLTACLRQYTQTQKQFWMTDWGAQNMLLIY